MVLGYNEANAQSTRYVYDANGRVVAVTASNGTSVQDSYNSLGHISQIGAPLPSGKLAIFAFMPTHGGAGAQVTIQGQGFDSNTANDAVSFNGAVATVLSATATQLMTTVPSGATTGPINVTVRGEVATSASAFVVDGSGLPPTISEVNPYIVATGGAVTITGTHLDPISGDTEAQIANRDLQISSASDTQLLATIADTTSSGYLEVETPYGQAESTTPLIVLPQGVSAANVSSSACALVNGTNVNLSIGAAGQIGIVTFNGTTGQWLSMLASNMATTSSDIAYAVYAPGNVLIQQGTLSATMPSIHLPRLLAGGTYLATFQPSSAGAQFTLGISTDVALVSDTSVTMATTAPGQTERLLFQASAGDYRGFAFNKLVESNASFSYSIYMPNGVLYRSETCNVGQGGCDEPMFNMPASGTYTVIIIPNGSTTMEYQVTEMIDPNLGVLQSGASVNVSLTQPGQHDIFTFTANAGQNLALSLSGINTNPGGNNVNGWIIAPDGTLLEEISSSSNGNVNLPNLAQSGTYMIVLEPAYAAIASLQVGMSVVSTMPVTANGGSQGFTSPTPGENMYFTFNGVAGSYMGIAFDQLVEPNGSFSYSIYEPNGTFYKSETCYVSLGGCDYPLLNLPATGTYTVIVVPSGQSPMDFRLTLMTDPMEGSLQLGVPANVNLQQPGQHDIYTFTANAGQDLMFYENDLSTTPEHYNVNGYVIAPDGTVLTEISPPDTTNFVNLPNLPQTGTYMVVLEPAYAATGSLQIGINLEVPTPIAVGSTNVSYSTTTAGEDMYFTFDATAGSYMGIALTNLVESNGSFSYTIYLPSGAYLHSETCNVSQHGCDLPLFNLPASGTYSMVIVPNGQTTMGFNVSLLTDPNEGALQWGVPVTVNLPQAGQHDIYTFSATAGQTVVITESNITTSPLGFNVNAFIRAPDGTGLQEMSSSSSGGLTLTNLLQTGTYMIVLEPAYAATGTLQVELQQ